MKRFFLIQIATDSVLTDLITKTTQTFSEVVTHATSPEEIEYWSIRTYHDTSLKEYDYIRFENGDKMMIQYTLNLTFDVPTGNNLFNTEAIDQSNVTLKAPFSNKVVELTFVLGWNIWVTGNNGEINNSGGPLEGMTLRAYSIDNGNVNTYPLEPPCITDDRGKVKIHPGWGLQNGDEFVCKTLNESGNAIDTTLLDEQDPIDTTPAMDLYAFHTYNGIETLNTTPTTSLVYTLIEESGSGFNATSLNTAKQDINKTFGVNTNILYDNHNDTSKDDLLNFVMELNSAAMSINDITTEENHNVPTKIDSNVFKGIADVIKDKSSKNETIDLADNTVGGSIQKIIDKVSRRRHGIGPNDVTIDTTKYDKLERRSAMRRIILRNRNLHLFGQTIAPTADKESRRLSRIRSKNSDEITKTG